MIKKSKKVVFFGTGGTISAKTDNPSEVLNYTAGEVGVQDLVEQAVLPASWVGTEFEAVQEQIAQVDSKDMTLKIWQALLSRMMFWARDPLVEGFIITHGTDTLEETAFLLHVLTLCEVTLPTTVLTCAMRPSGALDADGPINLGHSLALVLDPRWQRSGVLVVCDGLVHSGANVQKIYTDRVNAFTSLPGEPVGRFEGQQWIKADEVPQIESQLLLSTLCIPDPAQFIGALDWPWIEVVQNYAHANGDVVLALMEYALGGGKPALQGIVVAGTGMGSVSVGLERALKEAQRRGVLIWQSSKCAFAQIQVRKDLRFFDFHGLTPEKARIALALYLMSRNKN